jgi:hypothetical protein
MDSCPVLDCGYRKFKITRNGVGPLYRDGNCFRNDRLGLGRYRGTCSNGNARLSKSPVSQLLRLKPIHLRLREALSLDSNRSTAARANPVAGRVGRSRS